MPLLVPLALEWFRSTYRGSGLHAAEIWYVTPPPAIAKGPGLQGVNRALNVSRAAQHPLGEPLTFPIQKAAIGRQSLRNFF